MHYILKADQNAPLEHVNAGAVAADGRALDLIEPRAWIAKPAPRLGESSLDLHHGLDVSEAEIDTVPADLLSDLFKR